MSKFVQLLCYFSIIIGISAGCKKNEVEFIGKCFCEPGWESSDYNDPSKLDCSIPVLKHDDCTCIPEDKERTFLKDPNWKHPHGNRCQGLCRWNSQVGTARAATRSDWHSNQKGIQLAFYKDELHKKGTLFEARLKEFVESYQHWTYLKGLNLGKVIEFGAGPYTQLRNLMENVNVSVDSVTLLDTQVHDYAKLEACTYHGGAFEVNGRKYPTTIVNSTVEEFAKAQQAAAVPPGQYDTVIMMNVLVYALDAFQFLETLHYNLKPGGLLLFHDRWFTDSAKSSRCRITHYGNNVVHVAKPLIDHFMSHYSHEPFLSAKQTASMHARSHRVCAGLDNEQGYFAAVRKLKQ